MRWHSFRAFFDIHFPRSGNYIRNLQQHSDSRSSLTFKSLSVKQYKGVFVVFQQLVPSHMGELSGQCAPVCAQVFRQLRPVHRNFDFGASLLLGSQRQIGQNFSAQRLLRNDLDLFLKSSVLFRNHARQIFDKLVVSHAGH